MLEYLQVRFYESLLGVDRETQMTLCSMVAAEMTDVDDMLASGSNVPLAVDSHKKALFDRHNVKNIV